MKPLHAILVCLAMLSVVPACTLKTYTFEPDRDAARDAADIVVTDAQPMCSVGSSRLLAIGDTFSGTTQLQTPAAIEESRCLIAARAPFRSGTTSNIVVGRYDLLHFVLTERRGIVLSVTNSSGNFTNEVLVSIRSNCTDALSEHACQLTNGASAGVVRAVLEPGAYTVVVQQIARDPNPLLTAPLNYQVTLSSFSSPPPHADCETATIRDADTGITRLFSETTANGGNPAPICVQTSSRAFYRIRIPQGLRLRAEVLPVSGSADLFVAASESCLADSCLARGSVLTQTSGGQRAVLNFDNLFASATVVVLSVGAAQSLTPMDSVFNLNFTAYAIPYRRETITANCETLPTGSDLTPTSGTWTDNQQAPGPVLPFGFQYFGSSINAVRVSANGFLLVAPDQASLPAESASATVPHFLETGSLNGAIAPFWADLKAGTGATVRAATFTSGMQRYVVEWTGWGVAGSPATSTRFQAKLMADNSIEFHYCGITGTEPAGVAALSGSAALVGLQSMNGNDALTVARMEAMRTNPSTAFRFVPMF